MNYKSISNLSEDIRLNMNLIASNFDLVVGVPRSGMLPATIIGLYLNINICSLNDLIKNNQISHGTRLIKTEIKYPHEAKKILIVDDSLDTGSALTKVKDQINKNFQNKHISYLAVYVTSHSTNMVDYYFKILNQPRFFEWNILQREFLKYCCLDMDGVLCIDPNEKENDDGERYKDFLKNASPLHIPRYAIGHIVTSRLEKYRNETVDWLKKHHIKYDHLHMLNVETAQERREKNLHAPFKAEIYHKLFDTKLFIESDRSQSIKIANLSGKLCLCFSTQEIFNSNSFLKKTHTKIKDKIKKLFKKIFIIF